MWRVDTYSGDGGPAAAAQLNTPWGEAVDNRVNLYISDSGNHTVRKKYAANPGSPLDKAWQQLRKAPRIARAELNERAEREAADLAKANARISDSEARVKEAEAQVAKANATSKDAVARVAEAQRGAAEASAKAESFRLDIAKANERAADANKIAESERLARLQLEARLADRSLTAAQQAQLVSRLKSFPKIKVDVVIFGDTPEVGIISGMLLDCMTKAAWDVHVGSAGPGMVVRGILVGIRPNSDVATVGAFHALLSALESTGVAAGPWEFDKLPYPSPLFNTNLTKDAPLKVFIGSKPQ